MLLGAEAEVDALCVTDCILGGVSAVLLCGEDFASAVGDGFGFETEAEAEADVSISVCCSALASVIVYHIVPR